MSGARVFFVLPAKSFNKFISAFRNKDNFLITINFGAVLLFFSISFCVIFISLLIICQKDYSDFY